MKFFKGEKSKGLLFVVLAIVMATLAMLIVFSIGSKMSPSVPALEAKDDIKVGTPLDRSMFREVKLAEANLPSKLVDVKVDFTGLVAAKDVSAGDVFRETAILFLESNNLALFSARLSALDNPELRAVEIPTDSVEGLISGMGPKDRVDLVAVYKELEVSDQFSAVVEDVVTSKTIVRGAHVLGVKLGDSENIEGTPSTILIVALNEKDIEKVSLYRELGNIYISLRPLGTEVKDEELKVEPDKTEKPKGPKVEIEKIGDVEDINVDDVLNPENLEAPEVKEE